MALWLHYLSDPWPLATTEQVALLGGKGASLVRLHQAGLLIPPGFTITTTAVQMFLRTGAWPEELPEQVTRAWERLRQEPLIAAHDPQRPLIVAVRSGAPRSAPGLLQTIPYCGWTYNLAANTAYSASWREWAAFLRTLLPAAPIDACDDLPAQCAALWQQAQQQLPSPVEDTPECWLWQAIASVARSSSRLWPEPSLPPDSIPLEQCTAVTIQWMVPCTVSGVLFSRDPLRPHHHELVIEAVAGAGMDLLAGTANAWSIRCPRADQPTQQRSCLPLAQAPAGLTFEHVQRLRAAALRLEALEHGPGVDVEWGLHQDRLFFFQVRPLPALAATVRRDDVLVEQERARLRAFARAGRRWWVRPEIAVSLPHPTPLSWSCWQLFFHPRGGWGATYRALGYAPRRFPDGDGCLQLLAGRVYADPDRLVQMICGSYPLRHAVEQLQASPEVLHEPPTVFDPERLDPWFVLKIPHLLWVWFRSTQRLRMLKQTVPQAFVAHTLPAFQASLADWRKQPVQRWNRAELVAALARCRAWLCEEWAPRLLLPGWLGVHAWQQIRRELSTGRNDSEGSSQRRLSLNWLASVEGWSLPAPKNEQQSRPTSPEFCGELELAAEPCAPELESWRTQVGRACPSHAPGNNLEHEFDELFRDLPRRLQQRLRRELDVARICLPLRQVGKACLLEGVDLLRDLLQELRDRGDASDDLYFLTWPELLQHAGSVPSGVLRDEVADRRARWRFWRGRDVPAVLQADADDPFFVPVDAALHQTVQSESSGLVTDRVLEGTSLSPGLAEGRAWWSAETGSDSPPPGAVVVAHALDAWAVRRWSQAAAFVVETGGLLSHAAVTARSLGKPMLRCPQARRLLTPGSFLTVDAETGRITARPDRRDDPPLSS